MNGDEPAPSHRRRMCVGQPGPVGQQPHRHAARVRHTSKWDPLGRKYNAQFHCGSNDPASMADWHPRLEFVDEASMNDSPVLMAKAPANIRRMYLLISLLPGFKRSSRIVRFRF